VGISSELIDMLQGHAGKSVFVNHYLVPQSTYKDRVLTAITELRKTIEQQ
jgi:hypothetical protein